MTDHIYRLTHVVGTSPDSIESAVSNAVERASQSLDGLDWFEVVQIRGHIVDGSVGHYQVEMKIGFRLEDRKDTTDAKN